MKEYVEIGNVKIKRTAVLAPMAFVADRAYRLICKKFGAALVYSEMVSVKSICDNYDRVKDRLKITDEERPMTIQIFGEDENFFEKALPTVLENKPDIIDINMECPEDVVVLKGAGCALMKNSKVAEKIVRKVVSNSNVPVTVKIRKGWDNNSVNAVEFSKMLQDCGVSAIAVHGRTKEQLFRGRADWDIVRKIKESVSVPIILNGDIFSLDDARKAYETTDADLIMIGRGSFGMPFIFKQIEEFYERGKILKEPEKEEILETMLEHIKNIFKFEGKVKGAKKARAQAMRYFSGFKKAAEIRRKCSLISCFEDVLEIAESAKNF